ncbi:40S ribosomal protein S3 [Culex quinquefasciatus]|uniref:40S ribosomal protein S3 n=1 Tax=Culex quinquefasciatus TaxID=7176 RepID=B0WXH6_CULQU|nr:40S ribosomal protein S3 [Culex quinquefasciatus]|eukprot:XP_001862098.1 40S ribosomal protein S3 [Culex quinquefasciatus]
MVGRGWLLRCGASRHTDPYRDYHYGPRTQNVLGESDHRIRELNAILFAEKVATRSLCAIVQAESLCYKLIGGLAVCRACYGFVDGIIFHSDDPSNEFSDTASRHVLLRHGELGMQVKIMLPWDKNGNIGPKEQLSDNVEMVEPKDKIMYNTPRSEPKNKPSALKLGAGRTVEVVKSWLNPS